MNDQSKNISLDEVLDEAEAKFRSGMATLTEWTQQAKGIIDKQPAVVIAGAAALGFVTGLLLKRSMGTRIANTSLQHSPGGSL